LVKEQGSYSPVQSMGHKGPVLRPRCIGPERARTQIPFYSILPTAGVQTHNTYAVNVLFRVQISNAAMISYLSHEAACCSCAQMVTGTDLSNQNYYCLQLYCYHHNCCSCSAVDAGVFLFRTNFSTIIFFCGAASQRGPWQAQS
jgi:hypothetical protein